MQPKQSRGEMSIYHYWTQSCNTLLTNVVFPLPKTTFDLVLRIAVCIIDHIRVVDPLAPWLFEELAVVLDDEEDDDDNDNDDNHHGVAVDDDAGSSYDDDDENDIDFVPMHIGPPTVELQFPTLVDATGDDDGEHPPD